MTTKILIIGAGSVGQVFGHHLKKGGAELSYLVKSDKVETAKAGFVMYRLGKTRAYPPPEIFSEFGLAAEISELATKAFDYVFICTSSTSLRSGTWFETLAKTFAGARFVVFAVDTEEFDFVSQWVPKQHIIVGLLTLMSFSAPLANEVLEPGGTAYWFLPTSRFIFSGARDSVDRLVAILNRGSMPSKRHNNVLCQAVLSAPVLQMAVLVLECAGWSIDNLSRTKKLRLLMKRAIMESTAIGAKRFGLRSPWLVGLVPSRVFTAVLKLARSKAPTDLEAFFKKHYTKLASQSDDILDRYIVLGREFQLRTLALRQLCDMVKFNRLS